MKRTSRKPSVLSESLHQRLNSYALAASAAGVGALALTQPADGKIIYTPTHHVIEKNSHYNLDLNHDGKTDFTLGYRFQEATSGKLRSIYVNAPSGNSIAGVNRAPRFLADALRRGSVIPYRQRFSQTTALMAYECRGFVGSCMRSTSFFEGHWINAANRYLGLKFKIQGATHYGWARLTVQHAKSGFTATLTGYAYETTANEPIIAGQTKGADVISVKPGGLGHLAAGVR
jgi:hypothetical protein